MARFDVYPAPDGDYWLDCQSDFLEPLNSRFVVPLRPGIEGAGGDRRLNPIFRVDGEDYVMQTHFAGAIPSGLLRRPIASLSDREHEIGVALDLLVGRY